MLPDQRRDKILKFIEEKGFATLSELTEHVGASESTVRRDLEFLDGIGQIRRTRGGAAYVGDSLTPFDVRSKSATREKECIAVHAAAMVEHGETILLDGGTTTLEVARRLVGKSVQVVTNSLPIANLLGNQPGIELVFVGGYVYPKTGVALGPLAESALAQIRVRRLFMSVGGITEEGLFNSNALLVETERRMMAAADEVVVVADHTKFGRSALSHLCGLSDVHCFVVDAGISTEWRQRLVDSGIRVELANARENGKGNG